jgi:5,5'-dehydrodivanillate O-demethylase oxygenase subunit
MGELLRRYWWPVLAADELLREPVRPFRLLGEDLVAYRDLSGKLGLLGRHCPHRRADLAFGMVEDRGLRCSYHGWCFDASGQCIDRPYEQTINANARASEYVKTSAYLLGERAGLLWAYLGPHPAPVLPNWEPYGWTNCFRQIVISELPCNWLQAQENSIDPIHFEWLHDNWTSVRAGRPDKAPKHLKLGFDEFDYGFTYRRVREGGSEDDDLWTVGRVCLWPNCLFTTDHFEWRTPIDDTNTLSITLATERVPEDREPFEQAVVPSWHGPIRDSAGNWILSHVMNQDFAAWVGQGTIADRSKELVGRSDQGIIMMRRQFWRDLDAIRNGADPKAIVRDVDPDVVLSLPLVHPENFTKPRSRLAYEEWHQTLRRMGFPDEYPSQAGQPEWVRELYRSAMKPAAEPVARAG